MYTFIFKHQINNEEFYSKHQEKHRQMAFRLAQGALHQEGGANVPGAEAQVSGTRVSRQAYGVLHAAD